MKVVLFCGGLGTRIREYPEAIPKPMIPVGFHPLNGPRSIRSPHIEIDPALIERFGRIMRENVSTGSVPFRKAYLQSLINVIEVDDTQIRIKGSKELFEKAVLASQHGPNSCSQMSTRWRARRDSNS